MEDKITEEKSADNVGDSSTDSIEEIEDSSDGDESSSSWVLFWITWIHTYCPFLETLANISLLEWVCIQIID